MHIEMLISQASGMKWMWDLMVLIKNDLKNTKIVLETRVNLDKGWR